MSLVDELEVVIEGTYFFNHSAYCVGIMDGNLQVIDCTFLDNIYGIQAWNSTVELTDSSMVGSWLFGLKLEDSSARWDVEGLCRIVSSDIEGFVDLNVLGGRLFIEDTKVDLKAGSSFTASGGASVSMFDTKWIAGGNEFRVSDCTLELVRTIFEGVGPPVGGSQANLGVSMTDSTLTATNVTFLRARAGLSLVRCEARLRGCFLKECSEHGIYAKESNITISKCELERVILGSSLILRDTDILADNTTITFSVTSLSVIGGSARLVNCSMGAAESLSVSVTGAPVVLVNTSYQPEKVHVGDGGSLEVWWFVSTEVVWENPAELGGIDVWVEDIFGKNVAMSTTDDKGRVRNLLVLALNDTEAGQAVHGPHSVYAAIHSYQTRLAVQLFRSVELELRLLDEDPPSIRVDSPTELVTLTRNDAIEVFGLAHDAGSGTQRVEASLASTVWTSEGEVFSFTIRLTDGYHEIKLRAYDHAGNMARTSIFVDLETRSIGLAVNNPLDGLRTRDRTIEVRGFVSREVTVRVNRAIVELDGLLFVHEVDLAEGANTITVTAEDEYGHLTTRTVDVTTDWTPPKLTMLSLPSVNTTDEWIPIEGKLEGGRLVTIGATPVILRDGRFDVRFPVNVGETMITIRAVDEVGNEQVETIRVTRLEVVVEEPKPNLMEVVPFIIAIPLLAAVQWYVINRRQLGGEEP
jgi:hypothetical protein